MASDIRWSEETVLKASEAVAKAFLKKKPDADRDKLTDMSMYWAAVVLSSLTRKDLWRDMSNSLDIPPEKEPSE